MAKLDYSAAVALLEGVQTVAICGHINPDGDCLGSTLGLALALRSRGIDATPLLPTREKPVLYDFLEGYELMKPACDFHKRVDVFIAVDLPSPERMGDGYDVFKRARKTIAIDHHPGTKDFADVVYSDPSAAAAGMLIWDFVDQLGIHRSPEVAQCCYAAVVTDTGRFQFQNADAAALRAAASMANAGASPSEVCRQIYQRRSVAALKLDALVIGRMKFVCGGRAVISWVKESDFKELGANKDDGEGLIDLIRSLDGIEVAVMLREQGPIVRGSLRAKTDRNVAKVAEKMDGGGHAAAAGFSVKGNLETAVKTVVPLLKQSFEDMPEAAESLEAEATNTSLFSRIPSVEKPQ